MIDVLPPFLSTSSGRLIAAPDPERQSALGRAQSLLVPIIGALDHLDGRPKGCTGRCPFMGLDLVVSRVDKLSTIFGLVFSLAAFLSLLLRLACARYDPADGLAALCRIGHRGGVCR